MSSSTSKTPAVMPRRTMRCHDDGAVNAVVHLKGGQHILTCSTDGSLRLWDLERGTQIGMDWRDENKNREEVWSMALSPTGRTVASGHNNGTVKLWNVETKKVVARWTGHTNIVRALCWSRDNNQVASGSYDGTARVWDVHVKSGKTVLTIKTGHDWVNTVTYSPDASKIATGGNDENAVKIWDARTCGLFKTLKHNDSVWSLAWTSDGEKLFSGSDAIRIFNTATWHEISILEGHTHYINNISLSQNERLLASTSVDSTALLWDLDTSLVIGSPLQHSEEDVWSAALSPDGKVLVTGCQYENAYTWDVHAILKEARLEDLLKPLSDVSVQKSLMNSSATRRPNIQARRVPPAFFDGVQNGAQSSTIRGSSHRSNPRSTPAYLLERFSSLFHHSHRNADDPTELQQRPRRSIFSRGPPIIRVPAVKDRGAIYTAPQTPQKTQQQNQSQGQGSSTTQPTPGTTHTATRPRYSYSLPVRILGHLVLFLCCASQHANGNVQQTQQQQGQSQGQPATSSTPTPPPAPAPAPAPALPHQVQSPCNHKLFHCVLVSCYFFVVHPPTRLRSLTL